MSGLLNPMPNPQDPNDPMYQFIDTQPPSPYPNNPDSTLSHFTVRQFTPEDISQTMPVTVTKTGHGLQDDQAVRCTKFIYQPIDLRTGMQQLNANLYYVRVVSEDVFALYDRNYQPIDGRSFNAYIQGGQFTVVGQDLPIVNPSHFPPPGTPQV